VTSPKINQESRRLAFVLPLYSAATYITLFIFSAMSNVGIPIKLLFEAEGMKVTVEVGVF
jgi:hypothetical protein